MVKIELPLFLNHTDALNICVIDNSIIWCDIGYLRYRPPTKAFELLHQLYNSVLGKKIIPATLHKHLEGSIDFKLPYEGLRYRHCLIGEINYEGTLLSCLRLRMYIESDHRPPILLTQFNFLHGKWELKLPYQVRLSTYEAFILFSNMTVDWFVTEHLHFHVAKSLEKSYSRDIITPKIYERYYPAVVSYTLDYLDYLHESLISNNLSPLELLRLGGQNILLLFYNLPSVSTFINYVINEIVTSEKLTLGEKVLYLTLILCLMYAPPEIVSKFGILNDKRFEFSNNYYELEVSKHSVLAQLFLELECAFPPRSNSTRKNKD